MCVVYMKFFNYQTAQKIFIVVIGFGNVVIPKCSYDKKIDVLPAQLILQN